MPRPRVAVAALVLPLALAACSDDAPLEPGTAPSRAGATPGATTGAPAPSAGVSTPPEGPRPDDLLVVPPTATLLDPVPVDPGEVFPVGDGYLVNRRVQRGTLLGLYDADRTPVWGVQERGHQLTLHVLDDLALVVVGPEPRSGPGAPRVARALDAATGEQLWSLDGDAATVVGTRVFLTRCTSYAPGTEYFDAIDASGCVVTGYDARSGRRLWTRETGGFAVVDLDRLYDSPAVEESVAVLGADVVGPDSYTVVDLATGRDLGERYENRPFRTRSGFVVRGPVDDDTDDGCRATFTGLGDDGRERWTRTFQVEVTPGGVACKDKLDGEIGEALVVRRRASDGLGDLLVDVATGRVLDEGRLGRPMVAGDAGTVIERGPGEPGVGTLTARTPGSDEVRWRVPLYSERLVLRDGWAYDLDLAYRVRLDDGHVEALEDDDVYDPVRYGGAGVRSRGDLTAIGAIGDGWASGNGRYWQLDG